VFEPGEKRSYSNYGYIVLGAILEKVLEKPFDEILDKNIFQRLKLKNTSFTINKNALNQSTRYTYLYDSSHKAVGMTEHASPDGGIESSVVDVQKFYRELFYGNRLLTRSKKSTEKAFIKEDKSWQAYGGGLGVSSAVEIDLDSGYEIIVLANTDKLVAEFISGRVQAFIKTGKYEPIKPLAINYAYRFYIKNGKAGFYKDFKQAYKENNYNQFIGRTINELGMQLVSTKSWDEAFDIFSYLVLLFPKAPQAYDGLAFAHHTKGDSAKAFKIFSTALTLKPNFKSDYVSNNYGQIEIID